MSIVLKRIYDEPEASDKYRILVDRIWPRGVSKNTAQLDQWMKELAPSTELRKWFGHDPKKWSEFRRKYKNELKDNAELKKLGKLAKKGKVTLVYAAMDEVHNNAVVLKEIISRGV